MKFSFSKIASIIFLDGRCIITNPMFDVQNEVELSIEFIHEVSQIFEKPLTKSAAVKKLLEKGINKEDAGRLIDSLYLAKMLVPENSERKYKSLIKELNDELSYVMKYLSARYSINYADYSKDAYEIDFELMQQYLQESPAPNIYKSYPNLPVIKLDYPFASDAILANSRLGHFLFWNFGVQRQATFYNLFPVLIKNVPSKGARHPFEAYILNNSDNVLESGYYHYNSKNHELEVLPKIDLNLSGSKMLLVVTVIYERIQWRYRHFWAYKDMYYDLGHLQNNLFDVARELGIKITPIPVDNRFDIESLREECIALYELIFP